MGRLTADEYAKKRGKKAGDQLRRERLATFNATERKRAQVIFNPFTSPTKAFKPQPRPSRPQSKPKPTRQWRSTATTPVYDSPAVIKRGAEFRRWAATGQGQRALVAQFRAAPKADKAWLVMSASANPGIPESDAILRYLWKSSSQPVRTIGPSIPGVTPKSAGYKPRYSTEGGVAEANRWLRNAGVTPRKTSVPGQYGLTGPSAVVKGFDRALKTLQDPEELKRASERAADLLVRQYEPQKRGGIPVIGTAQSAAPMPTGQFARNVVANAIRFPAQSVAASYETARQTAQKVGEGDLAGAALILPKMVGESYKQLASDPGKFAYESPIDAALLAAAPAAATGRGLGAVGRVTPIEAVRKAASTKRSPIEVAPGVTMPRHYSRNIFVKGLQVLGDAPRKNPGKRLSNPGAIPFKDSNPLARPLDRTARELRKIGSEFGDSTEVQRREAVPDAADAVRNARPFSKPPRAERRAAKKEERAAQRAIQEERAAAAGEATREQPQPLGVTADPRLDEVAQSVVNAVEGSEPPKAGAAAKAWKPSRNTRQAVADIIAEGIQGIIRPSSETKPGRFREDLQKRLDVLRREQQGLRGAELRKSKELSEPLERILALGDARLRAVEGEFFKSSQEIGRKGVETDDVLVERGAGIEPEQALRRRLAPYAQAHMGADFDPETGALTTGGRTLSPESIKKRMIEDGLDPDAVAYVDTRPGIAGSRNFFTPFRVNRRPAVGSGKFTGSSLRRGTYESKFENIVEQFARHAGVIEVVKRYDRMVSEFGIRKFNGEDVTKMKPEEAKALAKSISISTAADPELAAKYGNIDYVAVRAHGAIRGDAMARALDDFQGEGGRAVSPDEYDNLLSDWQRDAFAEPKGNESTVIMPKPMVDTIRAQGELRSNIGWSISNAFRRTVLALHTTWIAGNVIEAFGVRLPVSGVHGNHYRLGKRVMQELESMDSDLHRDLSARALGGSQAGLALRTTRKTKMGVWAHSGTPAAKAVSPITAVVDLANLITTAVFKGNRSIEQQAQLAVFGKYVQREAQELTGSWLKSQKLTEDVVRQIAEGFYDQGKVIEAARYVDSVLGKYSKFSPELRQVVSSATPFLPWALNAVRFFTWTLPVKHPVQAALVVSMERALAEHFKEMAEEHPGSLKHEIPVDGGVRQLARYTPAGLFIGSGVDTEYLPSLADAFDGETSIKGITNKLAENGARQFFPQYLSILDALRGLNWKGKPATSANEENVDRLAFALTTMVNAWVPFVSMAQKYREGGGTPYDDSNVLYPKVKPDTRKEDPVGAFVDKQNPFRVIKTGSAGGSGGFSFPGSSSGFTFPGG